MHDVSETLTVANCYAQRYPGKGDRYKNDTYTLRLQWMTSCLKQVAEVHTSSALLVPKFMGSGLAGGDAEQYQKLISSLLCGRRVAFFSPA